MSNLNLNYGLMIFDDPNEKNPNIKTTDISRSIIGVCVNHDFSERYTIYPNETKDIATTQRPLLWDNTTELEVLKYLSSSDNRRIMWTGNGAAPVFRVNRNIGGAADTVVSISRVTPYVARIQVQSGTAWNLASVAVNDVLKIEKNTDAFSSPFSQLNRGQEFLVQAKGVDYIDFIDNGASSLDANVTLGADFATALLVMSQGPVKKGDLIEISGAGINPSNHGRYEIVDVSPTYIEVVNALGVDETFLYGTNSLVAYEYLIGFLHLRSSGPVKIKFGDQAEWALIGRLGQEGLLVASVSTHRIQAFNDSAEPVVISIQHAMVL